MEKLGSIRIQKMSLEKSFRSNNRYFKSYKQQMEHDFRIEKMDSNYLSRPNEKNKFHSFRKEQIQSVINDWEDIKSNHKKVKGKSIQKQTKEVISGLITFSKDFDLSELERQRQFDIVKGWIEKEFDYPIYVVQHNDEKSLHYHFCILNYDKKTNRPLAKQINTSKLQDKVFDYLKEHNVDYGHTRGISKTISLKEHKTIMEGKVKEQEEKVKNLETNINKLTKEKIDLKNQIEKLRELSSEYEVEIEGILKDFIDLGLSYKGKSNNELVSMFKRYLSRDTLEKANRLKEKLEKQLEKHKKNSRNKTLTPTPG